jgi:nucleotide-binding universal stress UspA family protein
LTRDDLCDKLHNRRIPSGKVIAVLLEAVDGVAPPLPAEPHTVRRILVAFDGSSGAWAALERAIEIAVGQSALLTIATVVPEPRLFTGFGPLVLPYSPETLRRDAEREMLRLIAAARDEVPANVSLTTQLLYGRPGHALAALAKSGDYDLVVTGPRPSGRLRRLLGAGVTRALLARTRASVLAIR